MVALKFANGRLFRNFIINKVLRVRCRVASRNWPRRSCGRSRKLRERLLTLDSIASFPCKENEDCYQSKHDKHPILDLESQKSKMLNQKLQRFRPLFMQDRDFSGRNILFRYLLRCRGPHEPAAICQVSDNLPAAR
jgi:hypothetical protein